MFITRELVRDQLLAYLNHTITLAQLVDWAEDALNEGELEAQNSEALRDIVARLGLADVREFGLSIVLHIQLPPLSWARQGSPGPAPTLASISCELCKIP